MRVWEKEGYTLAIISGFLYFSAYLAIEAKAQFYEIPISLLSIDIFSLTLAAIGFLKYFGGVILGGLLAISVLKLKGLKKKKISLTLIFISLYMVIYFFIEPFSKLLSIVLALLYTLVLIGSYLKRGVIYVVAHGNERLKEDISIKESLGSKGSYMPFYVAGVVILIICLPIYYISCSNMYATQEEFDFFKKESDDFAIINASSDITIAKRVVNKQFEHGYFIFKTESLENTQITQKNINSITSLAPSGSPAVPTRRASLR